MFVEKLPPALQVELRRGAPARLREAIAKAWLRHVRACAAIQESPEPLSRFIAEFVGAPVLAEPEVPRDDAPFLYRQVRYGQYDSPRWMTTV